jgi:hypothetical protein
VCRKVPQLRQRACSSARAHLVGKDDIAAALLRVAYMTQVMAETARLGATAHTARCVSAHSPLLLPLRGETLPL